MMLKFDHLVHFSTSPLKAAEEFSLHGFQVIPGGSHPNWGTYNSLSYFPGLRYIEWIGINKMSIASTSDNPLIQQIVHDSFKGEGFSQIAFRTDDIEALATNLTEKGFTTIGPIQGSRKREDGTVLEWSMLFIDDQELRLPFFIQWGKRDEERDNDLQSLMNHENGTPSFSFVGYAVKDARNFARKLCNIVGVKKLDIYQTYSEINVDGIGVRFYEKEGSQRPMLVGITGVNEEKTIEIAGGRYHLLRV
ncbi:VOC family protein [Bacillus suaedaesalsae]|uniref:VOC family protein n=1 Tax=Bacillus suaedaesalsae TaxID=2810349 RepID=A0ABS2DHN3_9BACI|nr:VOC family protein [Bacillus suaedaesalsae]MBM6617978.1 VOC family protein [Bacillus suaedaesalsae]